MSEYSNEKVALVTGGSRGIGAASARALAKRGVQVAISYAASVEKASQVAEDLRALGVRAETYRADQGDIGQSAALVDDVVRDFGRLDILVANAGVFAAGPSDAADPAEFDRMRQVNVAGVIATIRAAAKVMSEGGSSRAFSSA